MNRLRARLLVALAFLAAYVLPLYAPPAAVPLVAAPPDAPWLARVFPGVPPVWVGARLVCLLVGALLVVRALRQAPLPLALEPARHQAMPALDRHSRAGVRAILGLALAHAALGFAAGTFSRGVQIAYVALLAAPPVLLALVLRGARTGEAATASKVRGGRAGALAALAFVVLAWLGLRAVAGWHAPRSADAVDTWLGFEYLQRAARGGFNLLRDGFLPGVPSSYMLLQGIALFGPTRPASFAVVEASHLAWSALAGWSVGWLAIRTIGPAAGPVAAAALLFSPFLLFVPLNPSPFFLGPLVTSVLLLLLRAIHVRGSLPATAALGGVVGLAATMPPVAPVAAATCVAAALALRRRPPLPPSVYAIAVASFLAIVLPAVPGPATIRAMVHEYVLLRGDWSGLERLVMGQTSPVGGERLWHAPAPRAEDVASGVLLSPFALPRTPLRLWGDALYSPVGAALSACGLLLALAHVRRSRAAQILLGLLALGLAPGLMTSFDRPSLTRTFVAPVPVALLTALAFEALRRALVPGTAAVRAGLLGAILVAVSGAWLFDVVGPRLLAQSSVGIAVRALNGAPPELRATYLGHRAFRGYTWLHVDRIGAEVPERLLPVRSFEGVDSLALPDDPRRPIADLFLWSPGLEATERVADAICGRWPDAVLYTLTDRPGLSRAFAARLGNQNFLPALSPAQWSVRDCPARSTSPRSLPAGPTG